MVADERAGGVPRQTDHRHAADSGEHQRLGRPEGDSHPRGDATRLLGKVGQHTFDVVVVADTHAPGQDDSVAVVDCAPETMRKLRWIVAHHAEVDRRCAVGPYERDQTWAIGVADARRARRVGDDLVARRHVTHTGSAMHPRVGVPE